MFHRVQTWVISQLTLGEFSSRRAVVTKAAVMALKIALFSYLLNIVSHLLLVAFGLLPYPLAPALMVATILTPPVSFIVALIAYSVVGLAVYDLGISRQRFEMLSRTDMLSGLMNRRAFLETFDKMKGGVALIIFDIDRFKSINDTLGHKAGDDVIVQVARCMAAAAGEGAILARIGGEEFAVLLAGARAQEVQAAADAVRLAIEAMEWKALGRKLTVTVSGGISEGMAEVGFSELFSSADRALYLAKATGRNRIVHAKQLSDLAPELSYRSADLSEPAAVMRSA